MIMLNCYILGVYQTEGFKLKFFHFLTRLYYTTVGAIDPIRAFEFQALAQKIQLHIIILFRHLSKSTGRN